MAGRPATPRSSQREGTATCADAIIVAAGASSRMNGVDKRTVPLAGRPLLAWTVQAVAGSPVVERTVLVIGPGPALEAVRPYLPEGVIVVSGGAHRGASVAAGFQALLAIRDFAADPDRVVLVHDGARPLVSADLIAAVAAATREHGAAMPVVPVADTVRRLRDGVLGEAIERGDLAAAQTPQGIRAGILGDAFRRYPPDGADRFTDEAALLAACTIRVHPIPGDPVNLKVTLPADLPRAEALLSARLERRVGMGTDTHAFGPGEPLRLGGIAIDGAPKLHGHSDGDVVLHALADAVLGGANLGDLGRLFPADERTPIGIDSGVLLDAVVRKAADAGWSVVSADITITGARPRLAGHLEPMGRAVAGHLGLPMSAVSVKASTGNLDGATGAGRAIAADAIVTLVGLPTALPAPAPKDPSGTPR